MSAEADPLEQAASWRGAGLGVALCCVVETWGSSPRPAGSRLCVRSDGAFVGSVSGGCVEGAVVERARSAIESGRPELLEFGVADEQAWALGLACGGRIRVHVARVEPDAPLEALLAERAAGRPVVLATPLEGGPPRLIRPQQPQGDPLEAAAARALARDACELAEGPDGPVLLEPFDAPLRLFAVGAVHIAQPLAAMAARAGYRVCIVDPRRSFASEERFPGVALCHDWPDVALARLALDRRSAVVTLSHDPKLDDPALAAALASVAFYIGALGSRRTQAARLERLRERGFDAASLERIRGPVGLAIGARSPAEIAIAILAEMTQQLRRGAA